MRTEVKKTVLITGAGRRLGLFLSQSFLDAGWRVHAITRSLTKELSLLQCDHLHVHEVKAYTEENVNRILGVMDTKHLAKATDSIKAKTITAHDTNFNDTLFNKIVTNGDSSLQLIINNASVFENDESIGREGYALFEEMMFVHMRLPVLLSDRFHPVMGLHGRAGNIISITDIYADKPNPEFSMYCSSKAGMKNLSISLAKKYAPNIRSNVIQPGPIKFLPEHDNKHKANVLDETLLKSEGGFLPIYQTILFILDNQYLTGSVINVDGGRSLKRG